MSHFPVSALSVSGSEGVISACLSFYFRKKGTPIESDRKYKSQAVEREKIIQCLETARISPSANNSQPWKFVVVDDFEKKEQRKKLSVISAPAQIKTARGIGYFLE